MTDAPRQQGEYEEYSEDAAPSRRSARMIWSLRGFGLIAALIVDPASFGRINGIIGKQGGSFDPGDGVTS